MGAEIIVEQDDSKWFEFSTFPFKRGLEVTVKVSPRVEEFIKSLGNGETVNSAIFDTKWFALNTEPQPDGTSSPDVGLPLYKVVKGAVKHAKFTLDRPGSSLYDGSPDFEGNSQVNLSFLRIPGLSKGVVFGTKDTYPLDFRRELANKMGVAFRELVMNYMRPVRIGIVMSKREF